MPRGDKSKYTDKQERQADHIAEGYKKRGASAKEAKRRAWATVNKVHHGGEKPGGGGYGKSEDHSSMRKGGKLSHSRTGKASTTRTRKRSTSSSKSRSRSHARSR